MPHHDEPQATEAPTTHSCCSHAEAEPTPPANSADHSCCGGASRPPTLKYDPGRRFRTFDDDLSRLDPRAVRLDGPLPRGPGQAPIPIRRDSRIRRNPLKSDRPAKRRAVVVPKGVEHCPVADEEAHILLIEPSGTPNTRDAATAAARLVI